MRMPVGRGTRVVYRRRHGYQRPSDGRMVHADASLGLLRLATMRQPNNLSLSSTTLSLSPPHSLSVRLTPRILKYYS